MYIPHRLSVGGPRSCEGNSGISGCCSNSFEMSSISTSTRGILDEVEITVMMDAREKMLRKKHPVAIKRLCDLNRIVWFDRFFSWNVMRILPASVSLKSWMWALSSSCMSLVGLRKSRGWDESNMVLTSLSNMRRLTQEHRWVVPFDSCGVRWGCREKERKERKEEESSTEGHRRIIKGGTESRTRHTSESNGARPSVDLPCCSRTVIQNEARTIWKSGFSAMVVRWLGIDDYISTAWGECMVVRCFATTASSFRTFITAFKWW